MEVFKLKEEYIKLGQVIKAVGWGDDGVEAKHVIQEGLVKVDDQTELRRGRKLYDGNVVTYQEKKIKISS